MTSGCSSSSYMIISSLTIQEKLNPMSESFKMRSDFMAEKRSIPILHRDGGYYLLRPINQRLRAVEPDRLPKYGVYQELE